ncbi:MAG: undecaprenyl-phosphate glucose phosphotransferase [Vicingaceae bacterium]
MNVNNRIVQVLFFVDLVIFNTGLITAYEITSTALSFSNGVQNLNLLLFFNLNWILSSYFTKTYRSFLLRKIDKSIKRLVRGVILHLLFTAFYLVINSHFKLPLNVLVSAYLIIIALLALWRTLHFFYQLNRRKKGFNQRKVVIIGSGETAKELSDYLKVNGNAIGYNIVKHFDKSNFNTNPDAAFNRYVTENKVTEIFCSIPDVEEAEVNELGSFAANNGIRLNLIPEIRSYYYSKSKIDFIGSTPVLYLKDFPLDNDINLFVKRLFDLIFSSMIILGLFSWLFPIIALCIKLESRGSVFFVQKRSGKGKKPFKCIKFRSMRKPANGDEAVFKQATKNDSRITKIGSFIRKTSIDELPQFFNVFIGNMSVVGPRPHPLDLDDQYKEIINKYMSRHFVKPGITGLSQVMGYRGETKDAFDMKARVNLDNFYIENWTFFFDIKIILLTAYNVIFRKDENAY